MANPHRQQFGRAQYAVRTQCVVRHNGSAIVRYFVAIVDTELGSFVPLKIGWLGAATGTSFGGQLLQARDLDAWIHLPRTFYPAWKRPTGWRHLYFELSLDTAAYSKAGDYAAARCAATLLILSESSTALRFWHFVLNHEDSFSLLSDK